MITRAMQNNTQSSWKPFATSTPLKLIPDQTKTDGLPQKQFTKGTDAKVLLLKKTLKTINNEQGKEIPGKKGQVAKKIRRNRSNFYFNVPSSSSSSSEDESCLSSNGPTIKINLESSTNIKSNMKNGDLKRKIFVSPKNNINESKKILVENGVNVKSANKRSFSVKDSSNKEVRVKGKATGKNGKPDDKVTSAPQKLDSFGSKNSDYDHEDNHKENSLKGKEINSQNKGNDNPKFSKKLKGKIINLRGCESISSTEPQIDVAVRKECGKSSQEHKVNLKSKKDVSSKSQNSSASYSNDLPSKGKRTKPMIDADPETEIEKRKVENEKGPTSDNESPTNKKKPKLKIKKCRKDSSHQLFSDSMHQELINSLDLTNVELDEVSINEEHILKSPWKLTPKKSFPKRTKLNKKVVENIKTDLMEKMRRSVRQKQQPKEFWMPRNQCDLPDKATSVSKGEPGNEELSKGNTNHTKTSHTVFRSENEEMKADLNEGFNNGNNSGKGDAVIRFQYPDVKEVHNENGHVLKNVEEVNGECNKVITENVDAKSKTKKLGCPQKFPNKTSEDAKPKEKGDQVLGDEKKTEMDKVNLNTLVTNFSDVFKQLNQLPDFKDCTDGMQTAECWSLKNFKCGVLKVNYQCQVSHKTCFENSYLGGVLIKGSLKMKIGSKEFEVNQGDMTFVPPLTEWSVIGTHESESLFYYWCGRFKT